MKTSSKSSGLFSGEDASRRIDERIAELGDWRGEVLARVRALIRAADPKIVEEWKWNVPVWSHDGILCTGETYKAAVKLTFAQGAAMADPDRLFNSSLDGNTRRALDIGQAGSLDEQAFKALIREAVRVNAAARAQGAGPKTAKKVAAKAGGGRG